MWNTPGSRMCKGTLYCFRANPLNVEYTWFKDGQKIIFGGEKKDRRKRDVKLEHFTGDVSTFS